MKLIALVTEHDIQAENMYNTDETGFVMGHAQSRRVVGIIRHPRDKNGRLFPADLPELNLRKGQTVQDGSREFATAICCLCRWIIFGSGDHFQSQTSPGQLVY